MLLAMFALGGCAPATPGAGAPSGMALTGIVNASCSRTLADGRLYTEHLHRIEEGQTIGVNLRSAEFAPILEVFGPGDAAPLARSRGSADARPSGASFRAPATGTYRFRISAVPPGGGKYRLEINPSGRIDEVYPGEDEELARPLPGCAPLIMGEGGAAPPEIS